MEIIIKKEQDGDRKLEKVKVMVSKASTNLIYDQTLIY